MRHRLAGPISAWHALASVAEELDIEQPAQLVCYLRRIGRLGQGEATDVTPLTGGVSNRTLLVQPERTPAFVLKQALAQLRVQVEWHSDPRRIHREGLALRWLPRLTPPGTLPEFLFEDPHHHLLAMTAIPQPHENWKVLLLSGDLQDDHVRQFAVLLAAIHRGSRTAEFAQLFADRTFFETLRLEPYYLYAASRLPEAACFLRELVEETRRTRLCLVHGDYSPKNILVHHGQLVLLDHEVIHFGDPTFDLGFGLTHFLSKAHHVSDRRGAFLDAAKRFWTVYSQEASCLAHAPNFERRTVRQTLGCLLARTDGRSPLEYLTTKEQCTQRNAVLKLLNSPPDILSELCDAFASQLEHSPS